MPGFLSIAVAAGKGGVGKTTVATGVASILSSRGQRTLVVDLDPQSNAAWGLGVDPTAPGVKELLTDQPTTPLVAAENLSVLPGGPGLRGHEIFRLDPEDLADAVQPLGFEAVIYDCPPGLDHLERMGVVAAQMALVIVDAHPYAVQGAGRVLDELSMRRTRGRRGPDRWALVMSRLDSRRGLDRALDTLLADSYPDVARLAVRQDVALSSASTVQEPIMIHEPKSRGAEDLQAVVEWITHG